MIRIAEYMQVLAKHRTDEVVICSMTANMFWPFLSKSDRDLTFTDPMGGGTGLALGLALARPDVRVWLFSGDGSLLMYPSSLLPIAEAEPSNLTIFLSDNRMYGRPAASLPAADKIDFCGLAKSLGLEKVRRYTDLESLDLALPEIKKAQGPLFIDSQVSWEVVKDDPVRRPHPEAVRRFGRNGAKTLRELLAKKG